MSNKTSAEMIIRILTILLCWFFKQVLLGTWVSFDMCEDSEHGKTGERIACCDTPSKLTC